MKVNTKHLRDGARALIRALKVGGVESIVDLDREEVAGLMRSANVSLMHHKNRNMDCYKISFGSQSSAREEVIMITLYNGRDPESTEFSGEVLAKYHPEELKEYEHLGRDESRNRVQRRLIGPNTSKGVVKVALEYLGELTRLDYCS